MTSGAVATSMGGGNGFVNGGPGVIRRLKKKAKDEGWHVLAPGTEDTYVL